MLQRKIYVLKNKLTSLLLFIGAILVVVLIGNSFFVKNKSSGPCDGRQWQHPREELKCRFPYPPIGRWHAVYSQAFAETYNLPAENISNDLSPGIDYMEMDVLPYNEGRGTACLVNMLVHKPHDIALYNLRDRRYVWMPEFNEKRKLAHFIDLDLSPNQLKEITTFNAVSRDYAFNKSGYRASTFAMYAENVLPGYDYISANALCREISSHAQYFPNGYALWFNQASVWGRYKTPYGNYDDPKTPKVKDFYNSHTFIKIPHELISEIFQNVPIGGG